MSRNNMFRKRFGISYIFELIWCIQKQIWGFHKPYLKIGMLRWFSYLKMEKFVRFTKCPFRVFDRYENHMQDLGNFIYAFCMVSRSSSSHNLIKMRYSKKQKKTQINCTADVRKLSKQIKRQILRHGNLLIVQDLPRFS